MATQIGPKIGVDGEAEYRRQMQNVIQEAKTLKAEMNELKTAVDNEGNAMDTSREQTENFNRQIENQEQRVQLLTEQLNRCVEATGANSTQTLAYREQLANAQTVLNDMKRSAGEAAGETEDFAEAEDEAGQNAVSMGDLIKANVISEAILGGLKKLAELGKKAAAALWGTVTGAAQYADTYLTMSTVTGISTDQLQEFAYMAELVDVSVDTMTGSMTKLTRSMSSARSGNEATGAAFSRLRVRITNADGTLRDANDVFFEIIDALGQMEDGSERDALAMEIFGKSAQQLNPLIAAGAQRIKMFGAEAQAMGYVLDEETLSRLGALDDSFQRLSNLRTSISNRLGAAMAPGVTRAIDKLIEFGLEVDWDRVGEALGRMAETGVDKLIEFAETVDIDKLADGALKLGEGIINAGTWVLEHADDILKFAGSLGALFVGGKAISAGQTVWNGLRTFGSALGLGGGGTGATAAAVEAAAPEAVAAAEAAGTAAGGAFLAAFLAASPLAAVFGGILLGGKLGIDYTAYGVARGTIEDGTIEEYRALIADLEEQRAGLLQDIENLSNSGADLTMAYNELTNLDISIGTALQQLAALEEQAGEARGGVEGELSTLSEDASAWGSDMMASLADGMNAGANSWVLPAAAAVARGIASYLHHSEPDVGPLSDDSAWMPDMMRGFAGQIRDYTPLLTDALSAALDLSDVLPRGGAAAAGGGVNYGGVNVTIYAGDGAGADEIYEEFSYRLRQDVLSREAVFAT